MLSFIQGVTKRQEKEQLEIPRSELSDLTQHILEQKCVPKCIPLLISQRESKNKKENNIETLPPSHPLTFTIVALNHSTLIKVVSSCLSLPLCYTMYSYARNKIRIRFLN